MPSINEIVSALEGKFTVESMSVAQDRNCTEFSALENAGKNAVCFADKKYHEKANTVDCGLILINYVPNEDFISSYIVLSEPRKAFIYLMNIFLNIEQTYGVDSSAKIHPKAEIHPDVYIGPNCIIDNCKIAKGVVLKGNICIYDNVQIEENVTVDFGCILGSDGMGFERDSETNSIQYFPHIGNLIIGKNTRIYTNVTIAKGTLGSTKIGEGCAIDCFTKVGHNVVIENNVSIASHTVIGGSSHIGENTSIFMNAIIYDRIVIGKNCHIGPGSLIMTNLPDETKITARPNNIKLR